MLKIDDKEIQKICEQAIKEYPQECCGILLGDKENKQVREICQAENADNADRQNMYFRIDPLELYQVEIKAEKEDMEIVGFYHSHVNHPAIPSKEDLVTMIPGLFYIIVSVVDGGYSEIKCYRKTEFQGELCEIKIDLDY